MGTTTTKQRKTGRSTPDDSLALGPCCVCEKAGPTVRNMLMLPKRGPIAGRGWGCFQCHLPADGATAVVCDSCLGPLNEHGQPVAVESRLRFVCRGYPGQDGRIPIDDLDPTPFDHDLSLHRDEIVERALAEQEEGLRDLDQDDDDEPGEAVDDFWENPWPV